MSGMGGFADLRREAPVRPNGGDPAPEVGVDTPPEREALSDSQQRFLDGLSATAREATLRRLAAARLRDPRKVPQEELDAMDDDLKWDWLERVCSAEAQDKQRAAAVAAQDSMEGHQC